MIAILFPLFPESQHSPLSDYPVHEEKLSSDPDDGNCHCWVKIRHGDQKDTKKVPYT